jgi:uroporphyrinogen decarboxylase
MTPIENFHRLTAGGSPAWIPFSLDVGAIPGLTEPVQQQFFLATGARDWDGFFATDFRLCSLTARFGGDDPARLHGELPPDVTFDEWGVAHWNAGTSGTVDKMYPPLAGAQSVDEIDALPLPVIDTGNVVATVQAFHHAGYPVCGYAGSIYEWSWWLRGMEQFFLDLAAEPAMAEAVIRKVTEHTTRLAVASAAAGIDVLCFYDDAGMQTGMQIAPELWRRCVQPAWRQVLEAARAAAPQIRLFLHSCGQIEPIIPDIIELGFDILHPVQPECLDFERIYRRHGAAIVLCATISAQRIFPFGSPADVRREIRRLADIAHDRRCILCPSNRIQPETPWVNVLAFAEESRQLRDEAILRSAGNGPLLSVV